jgi:hypothetical protein
MDLVQETPHSSAKAPSTFRKKKRKRKRFSSKGLREFKKVLTPKLHKHFHMHTPRS